MKNFSLVCVNCKKKYYDDHGEDTIWCECRASYCSTECAQAANIKNYGYWDQGRETNRINDKIKITCNLCE